MRGLDLLLCLSLLGPTLTACDGALLGAGADAGPGIGGESEATGGRADALVIAGEDLQATGAAAEDGTAGLPASDSLPAITPEAGALPPPPGPGIDAIIPAHRRLTWAPGVPGGIPTYPVGVSVASHGASGNGSTDDTAAFKAAIAAATPGTAVMVPAGTYRLTATITINKSVALRGAGPGKTILRCEHGGNCLALHGAGYAGSWTAVSGGYQRGSTSITLASGSGFAAGNLVELRQDNDPAVFKPGYAGDPSWGAASVGQVLKVTAVAGNLLTLDRPLYYSYNAAMKPRLARKNAVSRAGVEHLRIDRVSKTGSGMNVSFDHASECWVRDLWLQRNLRSHVFVSRSLRCEVRDSVFNDTWLSAGGGQGYGAEVGDRSTDCLVENNVFVHLRHSMILQRGAVGNVYGYNYSRDPFASDYPNSLFNDIVCHGYYPYLNLFEGNTAQWITTDNVWGTNGSTTFFRNRIEKPRATVSAIELRVNNPYHNAVGNELGHPGSTGLVYNVDPSGKPTSILHGNHNHVKGAVDWDPNLVQQQLPASLYLSARPAFLAGLPWPIFGPEVVNPKVILPAEQRDLDEVR